MNPTLHKPVPLQTKVRTIKGSGFPQVTGRVVGISAMHVIFTYIVLLDEPLFPLGPELSDGRHDAIAVPGTALESEDGSYNWRLNS